MRIYHFTPREYALENMQRRRIKVATLTELNDPYDFACLIGADTNERRHLLKYKNEKAREFGLLCFSKSWQNPVQWTHYAKSHTGIALGFDVPDDVITKVEYGRVRPKWSADAPDEVLLRVLNYKYSHWSYEGERRVVVKFDECHFDREKGEKGAWFYDFDDSVALREVILGPYCPTRIVDVLDALGDLASEVKVKRTRLSFKRFAVVTQMDKRRWV